jgi:SPX domain protein involved in polyphosphate accumulation
MNEYFLSLCRALLRFDLLKCELESMKNSSRHHHLTLSNILTRNRVDENVEIILSSNEENMTNSWINNFKLKRSNSKNEYKQMKRHRFRKLNDIKLAFSEFYLMLILLKNYQTLNYTGFRKILKKHDKLFETIRGNEWR